MGNLWEARKWLSSLSLSVSVTAPKLRVVSQIDCFISPSTMGFPYLAFTCLGYKPLFVLELQCLIESSSNSKSSEERIWLSQIPSRIKLYPNKKGQGSYSIYTYMVRETKPLDGNWRKKGKARELFSMDDGQKANKVSIQPTPRSTNL